MRSWYKLWLPVLKHVNKTSFCYVFHTHPKNYRLNRLQFLDQAKNNFILIWPIVIFLYVGSFVTQYGLWVYLSLGYLGKTFFAIISNDFLQDFQNIIYRFKIPDAKLHTKISIWNFNNFLKYLKSRIKTSSTKWNCNWFLKPSHETFRSDHSLVYSWFYLLEFNWISKWYEKLKEMITFITIAQFCVLRIILKRGITFMKFI